MGEYYKWVNIDKKEYITPYDFDYGNKAIESMTKNNYLLRALRELLHTNWNGDRIVWLGDEAYSDTKDKRNIITNTTNIEFVQTIPDEDYVYSTYKNVSCLFEDARLMVSINISDYLKNPEFVNEYMIDIKNPCKGMFEKTVYSYKYVINYNKEIFYRIRDINVLHPNKTSWGYADPLPILMAFGNRLEIGEWLGDVVGVSNHIPNDFKQIKEVVFEY